MTPPPSTQGAPPVALASAGLVARGLASLIDLGVMLGLGAFAVTRIHAFGMAPDLTHAFSLLLTFLLQWGYGTAFDTFAGGQTPGKWMLGIRAVREDGAPMGLQAAVVRNLLRGLDALPGLYGLGMVLAFGTAGRRRLGDIVAGTRVVAQSLAPFDASLGSVATALEREPRPELAAALLARDADLLPAELRLSAFGAVASELRRCTAVALRVSDEEAVFGAALHHWRSER